jgi:rhodanese-related sulfurtransferase
VAALILAGGLAPVVGYWLLFGRIPTVTPQTAKQRLRVPDEPVMLVDVRTSEHFQAGHIDGAVNWPLAAILETESSRDVPASLRDKTLLLLCDVGMASRLAAWHLGEGRIAPAMNVRGGIQEWIRSAAIEQPRRLPPADGQILRWLQDDTASQGGAFDRWRAGDGRVVEFPFRTSPVLEQAAAVIAYFFFKPIYMMLSVVIALVLWNTRSPDLVALRWGMIFFFLGEAACAVNYFGYRETSYLWEYLHGLGMLIAFGFVTYAVLEGIDRRILMLSAPDHRCASLALCAGCSKYGEPSCGLKRVFFVLTPALLVLALMLPTSDWHDTSYNTLVFGSVYNYAHLHVHQQFENWYCAAAAIVMFAASFTILAAKRENPIAAAKIAFAAGMGPLVFGMLRMVLGAAYDQNRVWYLFWEETTELLFIFGVCLVLWIFRRSLLPESTRAGSS